MRLRRWHFSGFAAATFAALAAEAAEPDPHAGHIMPPVAAPTAEAGTPSAAADPHAGHIMPPSANAPAAEAGPAAAGADPHAGHVMPSTDAAVAADPHAGHVMLGALGAYPMARDASGTSWQPDSAAMTAIHGQYYGWSMMAHGYAWFLYDHQGGPRGGNKLFSESMFMVMGQHPAGPGRLALRGMISLDPLMGARGYPLLLQTGETADGVTPLIDRQHPHDFLMELGGSYSVPLGANASVFVYAGYPGEPAIGPANFMHRLSGIDNPEAPIAHHWLDATHITFGVLTAGFVAGNWKLEGSLFNGREPDENRWDFEKPRFTSSSARLSWNPTADLALQVSYGHLESPEILEPEVDQDRITASATYNRSLMNGNWETTFAWGQNSNDPGPTSNAYLLETAYRWGRHTLFARGELTEKHELFDHDHPLHGMVLDVGKLSAGYVFDFPIGEHVGLGFGLLGSAYSIPEALHPHYGDSPSSYMFFTRLRLV